MLKRVLLVASVLSLLVGCRFDGDNGANGSAGITCWDSNMNGVNDPDEDVNVDGTYDTRDCSPQVSTLQSQDAVLNHQHICETFAELGKYPEGCPSSTHTTPTGTLTKITTGVLFDDSEHGYTSCNYPPNNGLLSLEYRPETKYAYWVLKGGYTAERVLMAKADIINNNACRASCEADSRCVAAYARTFTNEAMDCFTLYHSDTINSFEYICGINQFGDPDEARELCIAGLGTNSIWDAVCP